MKSIEAFSKRGLREGHLLQHSFLDLLIKREWCEGNPINASEVFERGAVG